MDWLCIQGTASLTIPGALVLRPTVSVKKSLRNRHCVRFRWIREQCGHKRTHGGPGSGVPGSRHRDVFFLVSDVIKHFPIFKEAFLHFTSIRMATLRNKQTKKKQNQKTASVGEGVEQLEPLHCWWECKLVQPLWRQYGESSNN